MTRHGVTQLKIFTADMAGQTQLKRKKKIKNQKSKIKYQKSKMKFTYFLESIRHSVPDGMKSQV